MARVWVNGTFDIVHRGHIELINFASSYGILKVGIDTDERVKELKGITRPFNRLEDRVYFIKNIKGVDSVEVFRTDRELEYCIEQWKPDYLIVGDDYKDKRVIGAEHCKELIYMAKLKGYSTTKILSK